MMRHGVTSLGCCLVFGAQCDQAGEAAGSQGAPTHPPALWPHRCVRLRVHVVRHTALVDLVQRADGHQGLHACIGQNMCLFGERREEGRTRPGVLTVTPTPRSATCPCRLGA